MTNTEPVQQTLQLMVSQVEQEERATSEKKRAANELSRILGQPPVFPDVEYASAIATLPDEYYGHQGHEVIRLVLEKRKRANLGSATVAEIHHAMRERSCEVLAQSRRLVQRLCTLTLSFAERAR